MISSVSVQVKAPIEIVGISKNKVIIKFNGHKYHLRKGDTLTLKLDGAMETPWT